MIINEDVQLIHGDCLEVMKSIPAGSVDLILCDLPYGTTRNKWDSVIDLSSLWHEYKRVCRGAIVLTAQAPFDKVLGASNLPMLRYEWIWRKEAGTGFLNAKRAPLKDHENVLVFYGTPPTYNPQMRTGFKPYKCKQGHVGTNYGAVRPENISESNGERYPVTVLEFPRDKAKLHPTQKPVALMEYLIKTYTNEGDAVLDNCMGSGTTGVACINTGRRFIGIEKDELYFEIAKKKDFRMNAEQFIEKNLREKLPGIDSAAIEAALQHYRQSRSVTGKSFDEMLYIAKQHYIKNKK